MTTSLTNIILNSQASHPARQNILYRCIIFVSFYSGLKGDHLEDPGVDGRIILKWTCDRLVGGAWTG
jgi:hypothetical protein